MTSVATATASVDINSSILPATIVMACERRWLRWKPYCITAAINSDEPEEFMKFMHQEHQRRLILLHMHHKLEIRVIERLLLDDPRPMYWQDREQRLACYLDRRARSKKRTRKVEKELHAHL